MVLWRFDLWTTRDRSVARANRAAYFAMTRHGFENLPQGWRHFRIGV
jgi:hypothetical protein